ncbi:hypothetical protein DY000_02017876 [Brassica cretica]|uniref:Uncharacterized protein n=2 Tax=Brassica cretica TaxID=69181 RepID=A0ABQ7D4J0_BRACR|nr:hypothetical protein DY000_02017876 [Brassica cretica]
MERNKPVKQCLESRAGDEPELLKYMSKLPVFLDRADTHTPQEKLLSVGVLDWDRLQKWQHSHNRMMPVKSRYPSVFYQTDASLVPHTDDSSAGPSNVHNRPRKHRSSRQSNLMSNPGGETVREYRETKGTRKKKHRDHMSFSMPYEQLGPVTDAQEGCEKKDLKEKNGPKLGTSEAGVNMEVNSKADGSRRKKSEKKSRERNRNGHDGELGRSQQGKAKLYDSTKKLAREEAKISNRSSTIKVSVGHGVEVNYCAQHYCSLPCKADGCSAKSNIALADADPDRNSAKISQCVQLSAKASNTSSRGKISEDRASSLLSGKHCVDEPAQRQDSTSHKPVSDKGRTDGCSAKSNIALADADPDRNSAKISQCVQLSAKASYTSSRGKISEDRASSLLSGKHCVDEPAQRQDSTSHKPVSDKGRSISPFQRLSFSMGKASKTNSERVAGSTIHQDSMANSTKTVSQDSTLSSGFDGLSCNKPSEKDTTTTSHLRRFLEPLMKPRASHSDNSVEGPRGQGVQRIKLGIKGCRSVNVNDSAHEKKVGSSMVRAVLWVTIKNNQPLFTFAVNKESDIIAATQKKIGSSEEDECTSVYTFFSIKDHKRNSAWLNQRSRGQPHGIISDVVAQMRVSSSFRSGSIREFVLFSVELDQESTEKSDVQLKNELAAIIVKMPRWFNRRASVNTVQDNNTALNKEFGDPIKDGVFNQDISATVILQSGVHSMPHKGGPSSLIQRWRTGGSCDCGGWDMGCNLRILTNQHNNSCKNSTASNSPPSSNRFELYFLGEQAEEHPFLSYKPIKKGLYSVVYDSSLSQLQAFSICMALAESRKMTLEQKSSCDEHKARAETAPNGNTIGYETPLSPVGRV